MRRAEKLQSWSQRFARAELRTERRLYFFVNCQSHREAVVMSRLPPTVMRTTLIMEPRLTNHILIVTVFASVPKRTHFSLIIHHTGMVLWTKPTAAKPLVGAFAEFVELQRPLKQDCRNLFSSHCHIGFGCSGASSIHGGKELSWWSQCDIRKAHL